MLVRRSIVFVAAAVFGVLMTWSTAHGVLCADDIDHHHHEAARAQQSGRTASALDAGSAAPELLAEAMAAADRGISGADDCPAAFVVLVRTLPSLHGRTIAQIIFPPLVGHANTALAHHSMDVLLI